MTPSEMDTVDKTLLNILQSKFPLTQRPYQKIGEALGISEAEVLERVRRLKGERVIRQTGAIFDTRALGYKSSLVAMKVAPEKTSTAAGVINEHPGVSHNYERNHPYNLWFTLAVPPNQSIEETAADLAARSGAESYRILPTIKFFKIGVKFDMLAEEGASEEAATVKRPAGGNGQGPGEFDIKVIRELQEDLPVEERPFQGMAQRLGVSEKGLLDKAIEFIEKGYMRRFGAVLHHRKAGFKANAMAVWVVAPERAEEVGEVLASSTAVSHCYQRPTFPDWPYSHFSMIHGTTREQCEEAAKGLSTKTGVKDYMMLYSTREFKKTRVKYFAE